MPDPMRVYWDSCAWIGLVNAESTKYFPLRSIWEGAQRGVYEIWTSTYCYIELRYGIAPHGKTYPPAESDERFEKLLIQPYVKRVQLSVPIAKRARQIKRELHKDGLGKRSDAVHLATALFTNCQELHTWDEGDLLQFDGKVNCRNGQPLRIVKPGKEYLDAPLFAEPDPKPASPSTRQDEQSGQADAPGDLFPVSEEVSPEGSRSGEIAEVDAGVGAGAGVSPDDGYPKNSAEADHSTEESAINAGKLSGLDGVSRKPKVCPECQHVFQGNGWDGVDAHWKARHENIMPYDEAWPLLQAGTYVKAQS